jgi:hypothetical protein
MSNPKGSRSRPAATIQMSADVTRMIALRDEFATVPNANHTNPPRLNQVRLPEHREIRGFGVGAKSRQSVSFESVDPKRAALHEWLSAITVYHTVLVPKCTTTFAEQSTTTQPLWFEATGKASFESLPL